MSNLTIRDFRTGDADATAKIVAETIDGVYTAVYPPSVVQFFKDFHTAARITERATTGHVLVALDGDTIIGTGGSAANRIFGMFVLPAYQGKGLGKRLMQHLEDRLRADGHATAVLSMSLPSEAFYRGLGYIDTETYSKTMSDGEILGFSDAVKQL